MLLLADQEELKVAIKGRDLEVREVLVKARTSKWGMVMTKAWKEEIAGETSAEEGEVEETGNEMLVNDKSGVRVKRGIWELRSLAVKCIPSFHNAYSFVHACDLIDDLMLVNI